MCTLRSPVCPTPDAVAASASKRDSAPRSDRSGVVQGEGRPATIFPKGSRAPVLGGSAVAPHSGTGRTEPVIPKNGASCLVSLANAPGCADAQPRCRIAQRLRRTLSTGCGRLFTCSCTEKIMNEIC